ISSVMTKEETMTSKRTRTMYALVMHDGRPEMAGRVLSWHRSEDAARRADARLQRHTRRACGPTSWCETRIVRPARHVPVGYWLHRSELLRDETEAE
ncbi:MAG TPA: hypothetical protein VFO85_15770, partial [Vicinamibacteria bacterium]|nr:hypothetical protein [Vicinamibacteria bacterium]